MTNVENIFLSESKVSDVRDLVILRPVKKAINASRSIIRFDASNKTRP